MNLSMAKIASKVTDSIMGGLDNLFTSDDERNKVRAQIDDGLNGAFSDMLVFVQAQENERTQRHDNDMNSDSWMSKNIRPMTLVFLTLAFIGLVVGDSVSTTFTVKERWIELLEALLVSVYGFYFVSRGIQACTQAYANMKERVADTSGVR